MSEFLILYAAMETSSQSALARVSGLFLVICYPGAALLTTKLKYIRMLNAWETQDQKKKKIHRCSQKLLISRLTATSCNLDSSFPGKSYF